MITLAFFIGFVIGAVAGAAVVFRKWVQPLVQRHCRVIVENHALRAMSDFWQHLCARNNALAEALLKQLREATAYPEEDPADFWKRES